MDTKDNSRRRAEAKSVTEQAAEWLMILEDQGTRANPAFADWLRESPTHVQAYLRAATLDTLTKRIDPNREIETPELESGAALPDIGPAFDDSAWPNVSARSRRSGAWRMAASVAALVILFAGAWAAFNWVREPWKTYRTDIGEQRVVELQDGSTMTLNTNSRVQVDFTAGQRELHLLSGEAIFRVHRDPARPFRVRSGNSIVQAVGTEFNVHRKEDQTTVVVLEGRVAVMPAAVANTLRTPAKERSSIESTGNKAGRVYLDAGEELLLQERGPARPKVKANLEKITAWRQRRLVFVDEPLSSIGEELNRYNRSPKIRVEGAAAQRRYAVSLDAGDPESLIAVLSGDPKVSIEQTEGEIVVRARE